VAGMGVWLAERFDVLSASIITNHGERKQAVPIRKQEMAILISYIINSRRSHFSQYYKRKDNKSLSLKL
jgi:hypothetical protein